MVADMISNRQSVIQIIRAASSDIIGILSGGIFSFSLALMLLHTTHSAISFGLESIVYPIVGLLLVVPIGNFVDTHDHKTTILVSKLVTLVALLIYSAVIFRLHDRLAASIVIVAVYAINDRISGTGYTASVHELVNERHIKPLTTIEQAATSGVQLASPLLAALLYGLIGFRGVLWLEAIAEFVVILITLSMHFHPLPQAAPTQQTAGQWAAFKVGLRYIHDHAVLWFVVQIAVWLNLLFSSVDVGLAYVMVQTLKLGNTRLGWVSSACALGMLAGNLLLMRLPSFQHLIRTVLLLTLGFGSVFALMGAWLVHPLAANLVTGGLVLLSMAMGLFLAWINTPISVYLQTTVPTHLLGRVSVTLTTLNTLAMPVGTLLFSWLFQRLPGGPLFIAVGLVLIGLVGFFWYRNRKIMHQVVAPQPSGEANA